MPPRPPVTSFSVSDPTNEVVCPLTNQDGSQCRKRCFGEKRFRSMQEHIRRAHPQYYISKLPATEESFHLMINKTPSDPIPQDPQDNRYPPGHGHEAHGYHDPAFNSAVPNHLRRGSMLQSANAAAALAQLHNSRPEGDWQAEQDAYGDTDNENTYLSNYFANESAHDMFGDHSLPDRDFMGPPLQRSLSGRASSLQPTFPKLKPNRPRKSSVTENARKPKHERDRSKEIKRLSNERKSYSAEPGAYASNKRWEDLLDAAASATEEDSRDLTPIPQSPRSSVPPNPSQTHGHQFQSYTTSPLQNAVLTHSPDEEPSETGPAPYNAAPHMEPFPSVEGSYENNNQTHPPFHHHQSSNDSVHTPLYSNYPGGGQHHHNVSQSSGTNFHIPHDGLSSSSPQDQSPHHQRTTSFSRSHHYPHALHQAAAQAAAAAQHQSVHQQSQSQDQQQQQQQQHPYSAHHASYTAHHQNSLSSLHTQPANMSPPGHGHLQAPTPPLVQHYCAACHRITPLNSSYACTECICGICRDCVDVLISMDPTRGAGCPRCHVVGGRFKPFMLDLR